MRDKRRENNEVLSTFGKEVEKFHDKRLRSPIYFTNLDNAFTKEDLGHPELGFVSVPNQQDGFGNLDAKTHIARVPSVYSNPVTVATNLYDLSAKLSTIGIYDQIPGDILNEGLRLFVSSIFRKMSSDIVSIVGSVYYNGLYNHIAPFYSGTDSVINRVIYNIDMICRSESEFTITNLIKLTEAQSDTEFARYNALQALDQNKLSLGLLNNIAATYHDFIIHILNNLNKEEGFFDLKGYIDYITSNKWGDCANEKMADNFYSFAYTTLCAIAQKDCATIADGIQYIIMDAYSYLSKILSSVTAISATKDQK